MASLGRLSSRFCGCVQKTNWGSSAVLASKKSSRSYFTNSNEIAYPVDHSPKICSAEQAVSIIKSGDTVFLGGAAATPKVLAKAMTDHGLKNKLKGIVVCHMHTEGDAPYTSPEAVGVFRSSSFFMAANVRKGVAEGRSDAVPIFLQDIPRLFYYGIYKPDVAMVNVSPPDCHGFVSLGTSVDCVRAALQHSKVIIAQYNKNMPRTFGDAVLHSSHIDYAVEVNDPLPDHGDGKPNEAESKIGKLIAENLVEDGATLQLGIGALPDAVLAALSCHKDLGIHSEMFSIGVVDLVEKGVITNAKKPIHTGRIVTSFLIGSKRLYDFVHDNPSIEMKVVDYTNAIKIIAQHPKMTAINSAIEVDLTGQVCADSIGTRMFSGFGGQVDFIRGAAEGFDHKGKPIIALQSINSKTGDSKIVPVIKEGGGVVTTRGHVQYVVTEWGIAPLFGKSLRQRAHALINISHPDHREKLEKAAFERLKVMPSP